MNTAQRLVLFVFSLAACIPSLQAAETLSKSQIVDLVSGNTAVYRKAFFSTSVYARAKGASETTTYNFFADGHLKATYDFDEGQSVKEGKWWIKPIKGRDALCAQTPEETWCSYVEKGAEHSYILTAPKDSKLTRVFEFSQGS